MLYDQHHTNKIEIITMIQVTDKNVKKTNYPLKRKPIKGAAVDENT